MTVDNCPCGVTHEMSAGASEAFLRVTGGLPPEIAVETPDGKWLVPRIYIACHGLTATEVPELAGRYGFARAGG